jgi:hypothetical protein
MSRGPGSVVLDASGFGVRIFIRESPEYVARYHRSFEPALKLPSWECDPMVLVAFLLRIGSRPELTFQAWLEPGAVSGFRFLRQLSDEKQLLICVVTSTIERTYRTENTVRGKAGFLVDYLSQVRWDERKAAAVRSRIETLYPTPSRLWKACLRAERVSRSERACGSLVS